MITKRIIPCLDIRNGRVVKGVNFEGIQDVQDPVVLAKFYNDSGADELVFYDITASFEGRSLFSDVLKNVASNIFIPLTVGGNINSVDDFDRVLKSGADKVSVNSGAIRNPSLIGEAAKKIAEGDFNARLEKKTDDEIGDLCETINYMADELGATERMKNDFISSVSHELRTPLTAIKGWAEMLEDSSKDNSIDNATLQRGMGVIIGETERLSVMVEELLDFSRLQSGRMVLQPMKLDIIAELSEAVLTFEQRAIREKKDLIYTESDDIIPVMGDKNRLRQVFVNIIDNALKYSDEGGSVTITAVRTEKGFVDIAVKDTGIGIPADQLEKVKTKFFKGNATRRGSGIGLAVADEIIRMHGGEINLDSIEGEGTTVVIRLPIDK